MTSEDEGIRTVREVREKISSECDHDARKLVEHLLEEQKRYADRLIADAKRTGGVGDTSKGS